MTVHAEPPDRPVIVAQVGPPTTLTRRIVALAPIWLGASILIGGDQRFRTAGFAVPRELAPWWVWGAGFITLGALMAFQAWRSSERVFWPAYLTAVGMAVWAVSLYLSTRVHVPPGAPAPAYTGAALYSWVALVMAATAARDVPRRRRQTPET